MTKANATKRITPYAINKGRGENLNNSMRGWNI